MDTRRVVYGVELHRASGMMDTLSRLRSYGITYTIDYEGKLCLVAVSCPKKSLKVLELYEKIFWEQYAQKDYQLVVSRRVRFQTRRWLKKLGYAYKETSLEGPRRRYQLTLTLTGNEFAEIEAAWGLRFKQDQEA